MSHTDLDLLSFQKANVDPASVEPRETTTPCPICRRQTNNHSGYCDAHYIAPFPTRHPTPERILATLVKSLAGVLSDNALKNDLLFSVLLARGIVVDIASTFYGNTEFDWETGDWAFLDKL